MKSMTGFGQHSLSSDVVDLEISIRAVNGRFLDIRLRLPREYAPLEQDLKRKVQSKIARGTIDITVIRKPSSKTGPKLSVNSKLAMAWVKAYRELGKTLGLKGDLSLKQMIQWPEVVSVDESTDPREKEYLIGCLKEALKECDLERKREGSALKKELLNLLLTLEERVNQISSFKEQANDILSHRLKEKLGRFGFESSIEDQRMAMEIVIQVDRSDVSEELSRLEEHIKNFRDLIKSTGPQGKKLDFYTQELLREINTIGSKSFLSEMTQLTVDSKTIIEKIREQVQNAE